MSRTYRCPVCQEKNTPLGNGSGLAMALYHLDPRQAGTIRTGKGNCPERRDGQTGVMLAHHVIDGACIHCRQAGTGAAPDVYVAQRGTSAWTYQILAHGHGYVQPTDCATEAAALRAAREAAGFGHVAERPCYCDPQTCRIWDAEDGEECPHCAWSRDAHKEGSK